MGRFDVMYSFACLCEFISSCNCSEAVDRPWTGCVCCTEYGIDVRLFGD